MAAPRVHHWAAALTGWSVMNAFRLTWDMQLHDPDDVHGGVRNGARPVVATFWHRHIIPMCVTFRHTRVCVAVSQSSDGEYIAQTLRRFGLQPVRGSSSRGAVRVLRRLVQMAGQNWTPALTPDGPRGPLYSVQPGFVLVARRCGLPVRPVGVAVEPAWELSSWDRFVVPKPTARIRVVIADPLYPREYDGTDAFCSAMREALFRADADARDRL
jgi:hypothetical protein